MSAPSHRLDPLDAADDALVAAVDGAMAGTVRLAGPLFGCGPGRTDCCLGPFPVRRLDVLGETFVAFARAGRPRTL